MLILYHVVGISLTNRDLSNEQWTLEYPNSLSTHLLKNKSPLSIQFDFFATQLFYIFLCSRSRDDNAIDITTMRGLQSTAKLVKIQ